MTPLQYRLGDPPQQLTLGPEALATLDRYRQTRWYHLEAGGQLFARIYEREVVVEVASPPKRSDRRGRAFFKPSRRCEQIEIDEMHTCGFHYVGDWHSHPEDVPTPSKKDIQSIGAAVRKSDHDLGGFLLLIVGRRPGQRGIHLSIHDGSQSIELQPV